MAVEGRVAGIVRRVTWRYLPFLMLCYTFAYLDRVNIGFAKDAMEADIGLGAAAYGFGAGIFFIGYFFFEVPSNLLLQRFGARRWISRIMITWSLVSASFAFVETPLAFYALRFLLGVAEAGFFPGVVLFVTQWWPPARRAQVIALFMTAIPLAGLFGAPLSGAILSLTDGAAGIAGWRWMFLIEAAPAFLLGLLVLVRLDSRIEDAKWLSADEKAVLTAAVADEGQSIEHVGIGKLMLNKTVLVFALVYFCCIMGQYGITFWLPTLIADASESSMLVVGLLGAIPYAFAVICMVVVGRSSDRRGERRWHTVMPLAIGGVALAASPLAHGNFTLSLLVLTLAAGAILTATPLFWTIPTQRISGRAAAVGIAAINSAGNLAGFLSPLAVGTLAEWTKSLSAGMILLGLFLLAGAMVLWMATRDAAGSGTGPASAKD